MEKCHQQHKSNRSRAMMQKKNKPQGMEPRTKNDSDRTQDICIPFDPF